MLYLKNDRGGSLIELILIVLIILAIIVVVAIKARGLLKTSEVEDIMTNMVTIKANSKIYAEEINAQIVNEENSEEKKVQLYESEYNMYKTEITEIEEYIENSYIENENYECYKLSYECLSLMKIEEQYKETYNEDFYVIYNTQDYSDIEVVYKPGIIYNENTYYTLTNLQEVIEE